MSVAGAALGLVAAEAMLKIISSWISTDVMQYVPFFADLRLNSHVLLFAGGMAFCATILFSITPVIRLPLRELRDGLAEGSRGYAGTLWRRFGANLVIVELAVAVVLLVGAGLLGKSLYRLLQVDVGFQADHLATAGIAL